MPLLFRLRWFRLASLVLCWILGAAWPAAAQDDEYIVYRLKAGDTLLALVAQYMQGPDALRQIVKVNGIRNPNFVPVEFALKIPRQLIKHEPSSATVSRLNCSNITRLAGDSAVSLQVGDSLVEGHVVRIPGGCQMAVTLQDNSVLRMLSGAVIQFKTLRRNILEQSPEVRLVLLDGRIEMGVQGRRQATDAPFEVRTPTSVAGVRGTDFRVAFDANQRNSQVEVVKGAVAAQGSADRQGQTVQGGQGVSILADGRALPVEDFLAAPRYASAVPESASGRWLLTLNAPTQARRFLLRESEDASFMFFKAEQTLDQARLEVADFGPNAVFQQWFSVSPTGIVGHGINYGFCKGYLRQELWRCNIHFNLTGLNKPRLRLQKVEPSGQLLTIVDQLIQIAASEQLVFRGLPSGQYKWHLEYDLNATRRTNAEGDFELVAIASDR